VRRAIVWVPLASFALLFALVGWGLMRPADRTVRSELIGQELPELNLPAMVPGKPGVSAAALKGRPYLLNIFASWCVPCVAEAPQLVRLRAMGVPVVGVAVRDTSDAVRAFLARHGDGYSAIGSDTASRVQLAIGSSGVPETFVVDAGGRIALQHVGDVRADDVDALAAAVRGGR